MNFFRRSLILQVLYLAMILLLCRVSPTAWAGYGGPDQTFGVSNGRVVIAGSYGYNHMSVTVLQPDGRILIGGICRTSVSSAPDQTCVARLLSNGQLDTSFGLGGFYLGGTSATNCVGGGALSVASDGLIYVGGATTRTVNGQAIPHFCVTRLDASGAVDSTYGLGGVAVSPPINVWFITNAPMTLHLLESGAVVLTAQCMPLVSSGANGSVFCATGLHADGSVETDFGSNGVTLLSMPTPYSVLSASTIANGGIYLTGWCNTKPTPGSEKMCVAKLNHMGVPDLTWGGAGWFLASVSGAASTQGNELVEMGDGSSIITGACVTDVRRGCLLRLGPDGTLDTSFASSGVVFDDARFGISGFGSVMTVEDGAMLVLSGRCGLSVNVNNLCVWRVSSAGQVDSGFGDQGVAVIPFLDTQKAFGRRSLVRQQSGKIVVAVSCVFTDATEHFCATRLLGRQGFYDIDSDNESHAETDGTIYLRHLFGFRDTALTTGALGTYADRTSATDIATYLSTPNATYPNCNASIVGAPGGPTAMLDGIVLMRAMLGLTGDAVTNGVSFPAGTTRTTWTDIKTHLNTNCGMVLN